MIVLDKDFTDKTILKYYYDTLQSDSKDYSHLFKDEEEYNKMYLSFNPYFCYIMDCMQIDKDNIKETSKIISLVIKHKYTLIISGNIPAIVKVTDVFFTTPKLSTAHRIISEHNQKNMEVMVTDFICEVLVSSGFSKEESKSLCNSESVIETILSIYEDIKDYDKEKLIFLFKQCIYIRENEGNFRNLRISTKPIMNHYLYNPSSLVFSCRNIEHCYMVYNEMITIGISKDFNSRYFDNSKIL